MNANIKQKLKREFLSSGHFDKNGIFISLDKGCVEGNNKKYMQMYNKIASGMDFMEKYIGKLIYGNTIVKTREEILSKLKWRDDASVLIVSIGTGLDLPHIPKKISKETLDIVGVDISIGMLNQTQKRYRDRLNISLVNACAEKMPFEDDMFDILFHVGGINFFNDKRSAIKEIIRVAKPGSKILLADETSDLLVSQSKWSLFIRKYYNNREINIDEITANIPDEMENLEVDYLWNGRFYAITFEKPRSL